MKKIAKRWVIRLGSLVLSASLLGTVAALATGGDQTDPLVTLSYLNQTAIPQIVKQVEESAAVKQRELTKTFTDQINLYLQQGGQTGSGGSASYTLVSMSGGQVMSLGVGCEVLLRIGAVTVRRRDHQYRRFPDPQPLVYVHHPRPHPDRLRRCEAAGPGELFGRLKLCRFPSVSNDGEAAFFRQPGPRRTAL